MGFGCLRVLGFGLVERKAPMSGKDVLKPESVEERKNNASKDAVPPSSWTYGPLGFMG